jgi:hypothetical protein
VDPVIAVVLVLPVVAWLLVARTRRTSWIVGLVLLGWIALAVGIVAVFPRARAEVTIGYLPVAMAIIWIGRGRERRQLGLAALATDAEQRSGVWAARILVAVSTVVTCVCTPSTVLVIILCRVVLARVFAVSS